MTSFAQNRPCDLETLQKNEATLQAIALGFGMKLRVLNEGQHWEFRSDRLTFEWWPSTGRYMVNKVGQRHAKIRTVLEVRATIELAMKRSL